LQKTKCVEEECDFRPISLLWHLGKLLEKAIMFFYVPFVVPKLSVNQFAYQRGKGTTDAIVYAVGQWTKYLDKPNTNKYTYVQLFLTCPRPSTKWTEEN
jgi:hypothetical protein